MDTHRHTHTYSGLQERPLVCFQAAQAKPSGMVLLSLKALTASRHGDSISSGATGCSGLCLRSSGLSGAMAAWPPSPFRGCWHFHRRSGAGSGRAHAYTCKQVLRTAQSPAERGSRMSEESAWVEGARDQRTCRSPVFDLQRLGPNILMPMPPTITPLTLNAEIFRPAQNQVSKPGRAP